MQTPPTITPHEWQYVHFNQAGFSEISTPELFSCTGNISTIHRTHTKKKEKTMGVTFLRFSLYLCFSKG
jgi:hypothetical protein